MVVFFQKKYIESESFVVISFIVYRYLRVSLIILNYVNVNQNMPN